MSPADRYVMGDLPVVHAKPEATDTEMCAAPRIFGIIFGDAVKNVPSLGFGD